MPVTLSTPAAVHYWLLPGRILFLIIPLLGLACFSYIIARRIMPLLRSAPDSRSHRPWTRISFVLKIWLGQWKQPRYLFAGILHIVIFVGFLVLSLRSMSLVLYGFSNYLLNFPGRFGDFYNIVKDYAATLVFLAVVAAAIRRLVFRPARYAVPARYGKEHTAEAIFVLGLIGTLMLSESLFEASNAVFQAQLGEPVDALAPLSMVWVWDRLLFSAGAPLLRVLHHGSYLLHELTFFVFLCFLPLGKHFHVVTSLFNVYFAKVDGKALKPVRWDVPEAQLDQVKSIGVKKFEDFTWKHMLDFYSCADCGRCSDHCPPPR